MANELLALHVEKTAIERLSQVSSLTLLPTRSPLRLQTHLPILRPSFSGNFTLLGCSSLTCSRFNSIHFTRSSLLLLLFVCVISTGCVRRRMTVRSNPPGAVVYVDKERVGVTPVSTPFTHYGTREFKVVKAGYETLTVEQNIKAPWWQIPGIDFFSENVDPREHRDERALEFELVPKRIVPREATLQRANMTRQSVLHGDVRAMPEVPSGAIGALPVNSHGGTLRPLPPVQPIQTLQRPQPF